MKKKTDYTKATKRFFSFGFLLISIIVDDHHEAKNLQGHQSESAADNVREQNQNGNSSFVSLIPYRGSQEQRTIW